MTAVREWVASRRITVAYTAAVTVAAAVAAIAQGIW